MRKKGGGPVIFGRRFSANGRFPKAYQAKFGVPSFRSQVVWRNLLGSVEGVSPRRVLDVGCGGGALTVGIAQAFPNAEVTGIDPDPEALRSARVLAGATGVSGVGFIEARLEQLRIGSFDLVVALGVLEFAANPREWLVRLTSQVAEGGIVAFTAPHAHAPTPSRTSRDRFTIRQLETWMRESRCSPVLIREIVRGANRVVYRSSQALQNHRWVALALHPFTLPLIFIDERLPGRGEVLFCRARRVHPRDPNTLPNAFI